MLWWSLFSPQLSLTLCNPMDCSVSGLPVPHHLPEFAQVHVHCIGDGIQPSHPLTPSSPSAVSLFQHQGLFQWVVCLSQMTKILELQLHISPSSEYSRLISLKIDWFDFQESSPAPQLEGINSLAFCLLYAPALTTKCDQWEDHSLDYTDLCW